MKKKKIRKLTLQGDEIPCEIIYSRRRTMALQIREDGALIIRLPLEIGEGDAVRFAIGHGEWILKHRKKAIGNQEKKQVYDPAEMEKYKRALRPVLEERVAYFAALLGVNYGRISIRDQKTRWGSCSGRGNLNFNWRLSLVPPDILDYVVVHELAHRLEMNHSAVFWSVVEKILPDYRERRAWLRDKGKAL